MVVYGGGGGTGVYSHGLHFCTKGGDGETLESNFEIFRYGVKVIKIHGAKREKPWKSSTRAD